MTEKAAINIYVLAIICTYTLFLFRECLRVEYVNQIVNFYLIIKENVKLKDQGCMSVAESLPSMCKALLALIPAL